ncbi:ATP-binding protein [Actinomadura scrupuli]|uniref:ATP-binding protein n=1 Tax=Actinomadura scrupuli TaxID=559629 RepID=UPI003D9574C9
MLASPAASGMVRDRFQRCLDGWGLPHLADRDPYGVLVEVWDPGNAMPQARPVTEPTLDDLDLSPENYDANGGWGLPIVVALSTACGFTPHPPDGGKTVWARFAGRATERPPGPRREGIG